MLKDKYVLNINWYKKYLKHITPGIATELYLPMFYQSPNFGNVVEDYIKKLENDGYNINYEILFRVTSELDKYILTSLDSIDITVVNVSSLGVKEYKGELYIGLEVQYLKE